MRDRSGAAASGNQTIPEARRIVPQRSDRPEACDNYSFHNMLVMCRTDVKTKIQKYLLTSKKANKSVAHPAPHFAIFANQPNFASPSKSPPAFYIKVIATILFYMTDLS